jgi:histidinol-phosphate/aromatic aminotransferase/cobyric acid decarboxylase-like protein
MNDNQTTYNQPKNPTYKSHTMKPQDLATLAAAALMPAGFRHHDSAEPAQPAAVTAAAAIAAKVDELGQLHAAIADMKRKADRIRTELENAGLADIEGQLYRVNFAQCAGKTLTDWKTIAERLKASPQLIRAHTTTGEPGTRMTVKARQTH